VQVTADARSAFESRIKRRWWHYKPLDPEQLLTWWIFLDDVQAEGDEHSTYGLFERCLVPCASYLGAQPGAVLPAETSLCPTFSSDSTSGVLRCGLCRVDTGVS
jgi:hypothetical protein